MHYHLETNPQTNTTPQHPIVPNNNFKRRDSSRQKRPAQISILLTVIPSAIYTIHGIEELGEVIPPIDKSQTESS
jgi:hypothetical protein